MKHDANKLKRFEVENIISVFYLKFPHLVQRVTCSFLIVALLVKEKYISAKVLIMEIIQYTLKKYA